ncbi:MAG: two-component system response regulator, partial [Oscillospiraceae bacterium]|nr:two-component system response regulator [Oscillospiraceae bacterium]
LELAQKLLSLNPRLNVIFLTSYREYALEAWELGGSGYILKPLTVERVQKELATLRYPVRGLK